MTNRPRKATAAVTKPDFAQLLAGAKLPERTLPVCMRADLVADHEAADRELVALLKADSQKFNDGRGQLRERLLGLEAEMKAATYEFRFRGLSRPHWRAFLAEHPPRIEEDGKLNQTDAVYDFNADTGTEPLIQLCLIDPDLDAVAWAQLMQTLTERQFDGLAGVAWYLNKGEVDVPFSRAASRLTQDSEPE